MVLAGNSLKIYEGIIIVFYIIALIIVFYNKPRGIKLNKNLLLSDLLFTVGMMVLAIVLSSLAAFLGFLKPRIALSIKEALFTILLLALIIAPAEEIIFRGIIGEWIKNRWGITTSILLTSVIFGLIHLPKGIVFSIMAGIGGLFFSIIYFNTSSIINPIITHSILGWLYFLFLKGP